MTEAARPEMRLAFDSFARLCGAERSEIDALVRQRRIAVSADGTVSLVQGVRAFLESIRDTARAASLTDAADAARAARADAVELALAVDQRMLAPEAVAHEAVLGITGAINAAAAAIAAASTRNLIEMQAIRAEVHECLLLAAAVTAEGRHLLPDAPPKPRRKRK